MGHYRLSKMQLLEGGVVAQCRLLLGVQDTGNVTTEHCLPNLLFLLFTTFFSPFVFYCLTSTLSSTPRMSPKAFKSYLEENPLPGISLCTIQFKKTCHEPKPTIALNPQDILSCQRSVTLSSFYLIVFKRCCC